MQLTINCPYFRNSVMVSNGQQQQFYVCVDKNQPIDPLTSCCGDLCRFPNIEPKEETPTTTQEQVTEGV